MHFIQAARWIPVAIPILLALHVLLNLFVDLFFWDEWDMPLAFAMNFAKYGIFRWNDLWDGHFSHRPVLLKLIATLNLQVFQGNQLPLVILNWLGQIALAGLAIRRLRPVAELGSGRWCLQATGITLLLFTPAMALAWLWPICFVQVYVSLFYCLAIIRVPHVRSMISTTGVILIALACTLSMGNGLLVWPAILLIGFVYRVSLKYLVFIGLAGGATIGLYFLGLLSTHDASDLAGKVDYFVMFIGSPFSCGKPSWAMAWGAIGLLIYLSLGIVMLQFRSRELLVELSLGWLTLVSALAGASYRIADGGPEQALVARYIPLIMPFWLGILLGTYRILTWKALKRSRMGCAISALLGIAILLPLGSARPIDPAAFPMSRHSFVRLSYEGLREGVYVASGENPYINLFLRIENLLDVIAEMRRHQWSVFRHDHSATRILGSPLKSHGEPCSTCPSAGHMIHVEMPFINLEICKYDLDQGTVAWGVIGLPTSRVKEILIVDDHETVVGKGFPMGQFRSGLDPTQILRRYPREWIGFVSEQLLDQSQQKRRLRAYATMRDSTKILPLSGSAISHKLVKICPNQ